MTKGHHAKLVIFLLFKKSCFNFQNQSEEVIKSYILLELTKNRESCDRVIEFLANSGDQQNADLAKLLQVFNTSPGRQDYGNEIYLPVVPVLQSDVQVTPSGDYFMTKNPRGKAIIINVVPKEVQFEAQRFYLIFKQLFFEAQMFWSLTTNQIIGQLTKLAKDLVDKGWERRDQGLIVMIITHGRDEKVCGANHPACKGTDPTDIRPIHEIIDLFANVKGTAKMFFFTCCRNSKI